MSNYQYISPYQSVVNNVKFSYSDTQQGFPLHKVKLPHEYTPKVELRNYPLASNTFKPVIISLKENEILQKNAFELAEMHAYKTELLYKEKQNNFESAANTIKEVIKKRKDNAIELSIKEKEELERDIVSIIVHALKFTKSNNPLSAMIPQELNNKINRRKNTNKSEKRNASFTNKSFNSLINTSNISGNMAERYESNKFLKSLGLDLQNLRPDNININIDYALEHISKWKLVNKSKIKDLIRMRVINEISSVEERRIVKKVKKIKDKYNEIKEKSREAKNLAVNNVNVIYTNEQSRLNSDFDHSKIIKTNITQEKDYSLKDKINQTTQQNQSTLIKSNVQNILISSDNEKIHITKPSHNSKSSIKSKNYLISSKSNYPLNNRKNSIKAKGRRYKVLNSYGQAEYINKLITSNDLLRSNENLKSHFENVLTTKQSDGLMNKALNRNKIHFSNEH